MDARIMNKILLSIARYKIKTDFISFLRMSFEELNPSKQYMHNWHITELALALMKIENGENLRLIINMPPRYLKSICVSVCFVAWILGKNPKKRIIASSYSSQIAIKHSLDTKKIIQSKWYQKIFPKTVIVKGQNNKAKFVTTLGGFRLATSSGGSITGEGGDILIVDDPHKPSTIESKIQREKIIDWFENTFISRLDDRKKGAIIIVMQRLHQLDLCGTLLSKQDSNWEKLILQMIAEKDEKYRKNGELLHKTKDALREVEVLRNEIGERQFLAQYQQNPLSKSGNMFKEEYFHLIDFTENENDFIAISIDSASKTNINSDFTGITIWHMRGEVSILAYAKKIKLEFGKLISFIKSLIIKHRASFVLIEDKSSGIALIQELLKFNFEGKIVPLKPKYDKIVRFLSCLGSFERGNVFINKEINILNEIKEELLCFPNSKNDDIVDSISYFLTWRGETLSKKASKPNIRML